MFAQELPASPTTAMGTLILVTIALTSVLVWLVRHVFTTTLPELQRGFAAEMRAERDACQRQFEILMVEVRKQGEVLSSEQDAIKESLRIMREHHENYQRDQLYWRERDHSDWALRQAPS